MFHIVSNAWIAGLIHAYGIGILFAVVLIECLGLPLPGEAALVTTALYAGSTQAFSIVTVIAVAAVAAVAGNCLGYLIGRSVGIRLLTRYGRYVRLDETRLNIGAYLFLRHGGKIVFFGRFVPLLRAFAGILAGANRMPWRHFLAMNALGGIAWAAVFGGGAYLFGHEVRTVARPVSIMLFAAGVGAIVAGLVFFRRHERELEARAEAALSGLPPEA
jgi:membrane protein DedA with SNARE-associated domain